MGDSKDAIEPDKIWSKGTWVSFGPKPDIETDLLGADHPAKFLEDHVSDYQLYDLMREAFATKINFEDTGDSVSGIESFAYTLRSDETIQEIKSDWDNFDLGKRLRFVRVVANFYLNSESEDGDEELDIGPVYPIMGDKHMAVRCQDGILEDGDTIEPFEMSVSISEPDGLSTFETALEAAIYAAARYRQQELAMQNRLTSENSSFKASRILFADKMLSYYEQTFPYGPDDYEMWLGNASNGHALEFVRIFMRAYTGNEDYDPADTLMRGWRQEFDKAWRNALFENKDTSNTEKHIELLSAHFSAASDEALRRISSQVRINLLHIIQKYQNDHPEHEDALNKAALRLHETAEKPNLFYLEQADTAQQLANRIASMGSREMEELSVRDRYALVNKLHSLSLSSSDDEKALALAMSFHLACGVPYDQDAERYEDDLLIKLKEELENSNHLNSEIDNWPKYAADPERYETEILDIAQTIAFVQARVMGVDPVEKFVSFSISREECGDVQEAKGKSRDIYPGAAFFGRGIYEGAKDIYVGTDVTNEPTVAINIHPDVFSQFQDDYHAFEALVIHEQTHGVQKTLSHRDSDELNEDPRRKLVDIFNQASSVGWEAEHDVAWYFYRFSPVERHSFAHQRKIYALRTGQGIPSEATVLQTDIMRRQLGESSLGGIDYSMPVRVVDLGSLKDTTILSLSTPGTYRPAMIKWSPS